MKTMAGAGAVALLAQAASAAIIQNAVVASLGTSPTNVNLTAAGPVDWAYWTGTGAAPAVSKAGGTAISDLVITLGGDATYVATEQVAMLYDWSDGTPTATGTGVNPQDPRLTSVELAGNGSSLAFSVVGATTPQTVSIWGIMRLVGAEIAASLPGAGTVTSQLARDGTGNNAWFYSVEFTADHPGDVLTLTVTPYDSASGTTQERLGIGAVAVFTEPASTNPPPPVATNRPNVIIIFTDDHGYSDLGLHGIDPNLKTPALDALAEGGALMLNGYATAPQCVPSRAGILSGRIQNTFGTSGNGDAIPLPLEVPTIASRLSSLGYKTGMVGKWHVSPHKDVTDEQLLPYTRHDYDPGRRGFGDFFDGVLSRYAINFDLDGNTVAEQPFTDRRNRVIVQGEAAQAFIMRNHDQPFFLYLALYGPHLPRIETTDDYYVNFPAVDYPHYSAEMDDVRRMGLALIQAIDDAVAGVMATLRELGLEENTLVLFAGDNGAQPKFFNQVGGPATLDSWNGSENVPLRGEKGSLWEGGIKVPMFAYWKDHIPANQRIPEYVTTLDFTATTLKLAGGTIPAEFEGADILPRLTGEADRIARPEPMFWHWGSEVAMRDGDWKIHRIGDHKSLFNLATDPNELFNLRLQLPEKFAEMEAKLMAWYDALPPDGRSPLSNSAANLYITGAPAGTPADPRFVIPYAGGSAAAYPASLATIDDPSYDSDADGMPDGDERIAGTDPADAQSIFALEPGGAGELLFDGYAGRAYTVWTTPQLDPAHWSIATNTGVLSADQAIQIQHAASQTSGFFRVQAVKP